LKALAQANCYQGKTIRIVVGNLASATPRSVRMRLFEQHGKHIPANPAIIVQNMPLEIRAKRIANTA
jgi:hypothetical protein